MRVLSSRVLAGRSRRQAECLAVLLVAGGTLLSPNGAIAAAKDNFVKSLDLELRSGPVRVNSSDGITYDFIEDTGAAFEAKIRVNLRYPGAIDGIAIHLGECTGHHGECYTMPVIFSETPGTRDFFSDRFFTRTGSSLANIPMSLAIMAKCNNHKDEAVGASADIVEQLDVGATLAVDTRRDHAPLEFVEGDSTDQPNSLHEYSKTKSVPFKLRLACVPLPLMQQAGAKPKSVDIRVKQKGDTCPKDAEVTAVIDYEKPMTGRFRVVHNGKPSKPIEIEAREVSLAGKTWYRIERLERYRLDPGRHSFRIVVIGGGTSDHGKIDVDCPPFKATSAWLSYEVENKDSCPKQVIERATIHANRPGDVPYRIRTQGGLAVAQGIAHATREGDIYVARRTRKMSMNAFDQMMRLEIVNDHSANDQKPLRVECLEVLSGTLDLRGLGATRCEGEAAIAIRANGPGKVPYRLDCTGGKSWERMTQAKQTGANTFIGIDTMRFGVTNDEQVNCALKTVKPMKAAVLALKGRKYQCHKPSDKGRASDLAP